VEDLDLETVALGGSSFGGLLALRYALDHPDRVRKIVLLNPMGLERDQPLPLSLASLPLPDGAYRFSPRFLVERVLRYLYGHPDALKDSVVDRYYELLLRDGNRQYLRQFIRHQSLPDEVLERSLRDVTAPVLLQWGCRDPWLSVELANRFHKTLPDSSLITYLSAGHVPMEERPAQTARDAKAFLSSG
jgi:pimeloyl-ACP methyl ester carboxylesterase